ncbi:f-box-like domain-containing protein [Hirsutella rhossiliensis]|uniref:F-box-like domain-containing protein n=1 Tax=Hirsutella rhossiliensis TaxID=111463 RepID=A0A9P8MJL6_9HYPO|nr:f-box-like domain-containing protein [Hirsutella rhossiliensis]KAH0957553.1 f-box-like domain-containing protein [Hirsutella rhossiliensis]
MADHSSNRRFQLQVSECVETKTVTTTTRLTRKFPHVFVRDPTPLEKLDSKEYPLALKPTPPELLGFSYNLLDGGRHGDDDQDDDEQQDAKPMHRSASRAMTPMAVRFEPVAPHSPSALDGPSRATRSPSEKYPRRTRQARASLAEPPNTTSSADAGAGAPVSQFFVKSTSNKPSRGLARSSNLNAVSDNLRRSVVQGGGTAINSEASCSSGSGTTSSSSRRVLADRPVRDGPGFLATPDTSELPGPSSSSQRSSRRRLLHLERLQSSPPDSAPSLSQSAPCDAAASPSGSDSLTVFSSNVATPPITDADAAPFGHVDVDESLQQSVRSLHHRPAIDVVAAQDASLPSPRLSPTLAASLPPSADHDDDATASFHTSMADPGSVWIDDSQVKQEGDAVDAGSSYRDLEDLRVANPGLVDLSPSPVVMDTQTLLEAFDSMKTDMKTFMMYQFLRRCPRPTLRVIADAVNPALKCDFLQQLPLELAYHVLSYVDCRDLCRAAQVSRHWHNIVDRNETGWKELFDREGFTLPTGELQKAIDQGWGWQDPVGASGYEKDLSMLRRLTSSEAELTRNSRQDALPKLRTPKRKRGLNTYSATERSKRRAAAAQEAPASREQTALDEVKQSKSEGPLTAANQAAQAIPDPQLGLPSLRQLHLFKSLYRRHHMIRRSWTSGEVKPSHVAFAAHPRHVITCLQFDDDKIITGSDDTLIHIYDTKTGKLRKRLEGHEGGVWALQYEGNILVSGSTDRSVRVWDIDRGLCQQVFYGHTSTVRCLQILMPTETGRDSTGHAVMQPEKPLIITGSRDSQLRVWRLPQPGSRRYIQTHPPAQESDCPYFIRVLMGHTHSVRAISAHGDTLVSGSYDSTVRVWRISTGDALHVLRGHSQKVYSVVLDHERNRCISGSMDSLVKIWDLTTGTCLYTLEGHSLLVGLLDLRDERLVSAAADSTLRIWDPETGRCRHTLMAHTGAITCFQHDGRKVISGSEKTVKMWDVQTGECVQDLLTDLSGVWQVKFDGRRCVAAVQRDQLTYVEILDFGAIRDGQPPENLGKRILLNEHEVRDIVEDSLA